MRREREKKGRESISPLNPAKIVPILFFPFTSVMMLSTRFMTTAMREKMKNWMGEENEGPISNEMKQNNRRNDTVVLLEGN